MVEQRHRRRRASVVSRAPSCPISHPYRSSPFGPALHHALVTPNPVCKNVHTGEQERELLAPFHVVAHLAQKLQQTRPAPRLLGQLVDGVLVSPCRVVRLLCKCTDASPRQNGLSQRRTHGTLVPKCLVHCAHNISCTTTTRFRYQAPSADVSGGK